MVESRTEQPVSAIAAGLGLGLASYFLLSAVLWFFTQSTSGFKAGPIALAGAATIMLVTLGTLWLTQGRTILSRAVFATLVICSIVILASPLPATFYGGGPDFANLIQPGARLFAAPILATAVLWAALRSRRPSGSPGRKHQSD